MDAENGDAFLKDLANFIRSHEKALANSLNRKIQQARGHAKSSSTGNVSFARLSFARSSRDIQRATPNTLFLTPNQLYYLLNRFEVLDVDYGPMNVRVENIYAPTPSSNYVSFLAQGPRRKSFDQVSTYSVSSVRSGVSSLWSSLTFSGNSEAKAEKRLASLLEDTKYLYSAFTKIPSVKLSVDPRIRRIKGYEEFPFDTAVPVHVFKNLSSLEISDIDFRSIYGWDRLADGLRSLTVKRAGIEDPADLLTAIVLDDVDQRRRRSSKTPPSPGLLSGPSPFARPIELAKPSSIPTPSPRDRRLSSSDNARPSESLRREISETPPQQYGRSMSPRPSSRHLNERPRRKTLRSSNSTPSPPPTAGLSNRTSITLQTWDALPSSKWRFLRHLSLADNSLTSIKAESISPLANTLQSLDLSSNLFTEVPEALSSLVALRAINLSNCMIDSLRSLFKTPLPAITVLNLRSNRLSSLAGIERLKSIERFDVRDNKLTDPTELARLTSMPHFREVFVQGNPLTKVYRNHRITIFNLFRNTPGYTGDITIDGLNPNYSERRQLADRAPERSDVRVVRPPFEDDFPTETPTGGAVRGGNQSVGKKSDQSDETQGPDQIGVNSSERRKGPRRHVVDIHDNLPITPRRKQTTQESPEDAFVTAREARHAIPTTERPGSPLHQVEDTLSPREDPGVGGNDVKKTNYLYQQRIELIRSGQGDPANMSNGMRAQGISSAG